MGHDRLNSEKRAHQVDIHHVLEVRDRHFVNRPNSADSSVVEQDINPTMVLQRPSDCRCPAVGRGHVKVDPLVLKHIPSNDMGAFGGESFSLGLALPTSSTSDDDNFPLKPTSHDFPSFREATDASSQRCLPEASPDRAPRTPQRL